jgi:hypothetical protein
MLHHLRSGVPVPAVALLAWLAFACRENLHPPPNLVASVHVSPENLTVSEGDTATFAATASDAAGEALAGVAITWTSGDPAVASVGPGGLVHALTIGAVTIVAVAEDDTGTAHVIVLPRIAGIDVWPGSATLVPGGSFPLAAVALAPSGASLGARTAGWSSTDTSVVRVSPDGTVNAAREGAAWVVAQFAGWRDSARVRVVAVTFTTVSAGPYQSTCASGPQGAFCWGNEASAGNLGTGTHLDAAATPIGVVGGDRFTTVSAGLGFSCGLTAGGVPFCWGSDAYGRLGDGMVDSIRVEPVPVAGNLVLRSLSAGRRHACGLTGDGVAWCWGSNASGVLGISSAVEYSALPVAVETNRPFVSVGAGYLHSCGLGADSVAYCWGRGYQLGDSIGVGRSQPAPVYGGHRFTALSVGWYHSCGLATDGKVWCWGNNMDGELGRATDTSVTVPVSIDGGPEFASVTAGYTATCGLTADGSAYCWGWNGAGQLGTGDTVSGPVPRPVAGGLRFTALSVGSEHTCGLSSDRLLYCWGSRAHGMLGDGTSTGFQATPAAVAGQRRTAATRIAP